MLTVVVVVVVEDRGEGCLVEWLVGFLGVTEWSDGRANWLYTAPYLHMAHITQFAMQKEGAASP
jgi:hypothetical protein